MRKFAIRPRIRGVELAQIPATLQNPSELRTIMIHAPAASARTPFWWRCYSVSARDSGSISLWSWPRADRQGHLAASFVPPRVEALAGKIGCEAGTGNSFFG